MTGGATSKSMTGPRSLIPRNKHDIERVAALLELGYPAVEPVLPQLLEWTQDPNWPVAMPLCTFLAAIGAPVVSHVAAILDGSDGGWKYSCIHFIVMKMHPETAIALIPVLERLVTAPAPNDVREEVNLAAQEALDWLAGANSRKFSRR